jgi:cellulose synthase/poly-beta-1,6-N-acetylglucosamine synthase-like glycosyltransferase
LCCKNNFVGETEPIANLVGRLFSFQSEEFPDELNLPKDIPFRQPPHLAFPDHVQNLVALNRPPGSIERSKTLAGIHPSLDRSMVLFRVRNRNSILAKLQAVEFSSVIGLMRRAQRTWGRVMCVSGVVGMYRKSAVLDAGALTPGMATEDIDLTWKLQMRMYDVRYEPQALVWMLVPDNMILWWKQRRRWARGLGQVLRRHNAVMRSWKHRRMMPLYVESMLSVLWALVFLSVTTFWTLSYSLGHPPRGGSPIPNLWGMLLFTVCLAQLFCGVLIVTGRNFRACSEQFLAG